MAFSPDGRRIVIADSDKTARIWDVETGAPVGPPLRHNGAVFYAAFSHHGRYVVTASEDKTARVWDSTTGQPITPPLAHEGKVTFARFTRGDDAVRTISHDPVSHAIRVWRWDLTPDSRPAQRTSSPQRITFHAPTGRQRHTGGSAPGCRFELVADAAPANDQSG